MTRRRIPPELLLLLWLLAILHHARRGLMQLALLRLLAVLLLLLLMAMLLLRLLLMGVLLLLVLLMTILLLLLVVLPCCHASRHLLWRLGGLLVKAHIWQQRARQGVLLLLLPGCKLWLLLHCSRPLLLGCKLRWLLLHLRQPLLLGCKRLLLLLLLRRRLHPLLCHRQPKCVAELRHLSGELEEKAGRDVSAAALEDRAGGLQSCTGRGIQREGGRSRQHRNRLLRQRQPVDKLK